VKVPITFVEHSFDWYLDRLSLEGARLIGDRDVLVRCPAHEDYSPSLHVREDEQGLLVHCFAGCTRADIDDALDDAAPAPKPNLRRIVPPRDRGTVVATYDYRNADAELIFRKLRLEPKTFEIRRPVIVPARTSGPVQHSEYVSWRPGLKDAEGRYVVEPVPYNLPELLAAAERFRPVWIVDGEKDADALNNRWCAVYEEPLNGSRAGYPIVTCSPYGMGRWRADWTELLLPSPEVVVVADNDDVGVAAATRIVDQLRALGYLFGDENGDHGLHGVVRLVRSPVGKDAADLLAAGLTPGDFEELHLG
jgi:hypothetical protein